MTREQFKAILEPLVLALRAEMDTPTFTVYFHALKDVPTVLMVAARDRGLRWPRQAYDPAFPTAPMLRTWAEEARQALIAAHPFTSCVDCTSQGWVWVVYGNGAYAQRCPCWRAHQARLASLGGALVALPAGEMTE